MADIRVIENKEVWWATTKEYTLEIDGETMVCRIAENPKDTTFLEFVGGDWEESDIDGGLMKVVYEAWSNGELG